MRIKTTKTKNGRLFYVIRTYYDSYGVEHTVTVEKLGNEQDIRQREGQDPDVWAKAYVKSLNEKEKEEKEEVTLSFSQTKLLDKDKRYDFHIGYLFLQKIYYELGLDRICREISMKYKFSYDLNAILSRLIYGRVIHPASKDSTFKFANTLLEEPGFDKQHIYRALDVIANESDFIQANLYQNSFAMGKRNTGVIYYDCTNFFFEIEQQDEEGLRKYGRSKENRPLPIVEMGMFIDKDGIPLAMCVSPGNTNEQTTLKPIEQKILSDFGLAKFVVCTDAGLASKANRKFNDRNDRAFIVTQSIKQLNKELKAWALDKSGWRLCGERKRVLYDLSKLEENDALKERYYDKIFYKERWIDRGTYEEKMIVTFSLKYQSYQRKVRSAQIERAEQAIKRGSLKIKKYRQTDYRRFVAKFNTTPDGEVAETVTYYLDAEKVKAEEVYDGFYAVCSNLDDSPLEIIRINKQRWQIEECFRIMKTEFDARPVYLQDAQRIKAHFLTCYLSLVIYRYLEKALGEKYTCDQIISTLQEMYVREVVGSGYLPCYKRTDITDHLHEVFGFRTDYHIIPKEKMRKILKSSKTRKKVRKK